MQLEMLEILRANIQCDLHKVLCLLKETVTR